MNREVKLSDLYPDVAAAKAKLTKLYEENAPEIELAAASVEYHDVCVLRSTELRRLLAN